MVRKQPQGHPECDNCCVPSRATLCVFSWRKFSVIAESSCSSGSLLIVVICVVPPSFFFYIAPSVVENCPKLGRSNTNTCKMRTTNVTQDENWSEVRQSWENLWNEISASGFDTWTGNSKGSVILLMSGSNWRNYLVGFIAVGIIWPHPQTSVSQSKGRGMFNPIAKVMVS